MDHRTDAGKQTTELAQRRMHMEPMHIPSIIMLVRASSWCRPSFPQAFLGWWHCTPPSPLVKSFPGFPRLFQNSWKYFLRISSKSPLSALGQHRTDHQRLFAGVADAVAVALGTVMPHTGGQGHLRAVVMAQPRAGDDAHHLAVVGVGVGADACHPPAPSAAKCGPCHRHRPGRTPPVPAP